MRHHERCDAEGPPTDPAGLAAFVIARPTDEEATTEHQRLLELSTLDDRSALAAGVDPKAAMFKVNQNVPRVGTNGGTAAGLVGSYDTVARRLRAFADAGVELFMLQFQPLEAELDRFATEVLPRVRLLEPVRG
ncbi:hypothetical protein [Acrocarpospora catenulata]|uniref:hypothetical protein n=1 Tax=Acrocarpospora catenulata TaxID=2836182 RepID=UPI002023A8E4|nr:hypothetical protein [Acrocarpospora catenulata]